MPRLARNYQLDYDYGQKQYPYTVVEPRQRPQTKPIERKRKAVKRKKKVNPIHRLISFLFLVAIGMFVLPLGYNQISKPLIFGHLYKEIKVDTYDLLKPTSKYLNNSLVLNRRLLVSAETQNPLMSSLYKTTSMPALETKLARLMSNYKHIDPSIFVWEFDSGKYVDIGADRPYSAASIIKIPVLIQLFKSIEAKQLTLYDDMTLTNYYKAPGSGHLQYNKSGYKYSIDELARHMITESDNSATNMIMSKIGSMEDVNAGIKSWGLKNTQVNNWLPDMAGTNFTTANDLATMLYNLDNPAFLNINSREFIIDYMSHVENNRLIQMGLDKGALFVHKTGDIGTMLGDAGIVYTPSGKKYICVILVNQRYDDPQGASFIQKASRTIYKYVNSRQV